MTATAALAVARGPITKAALDVFDQWKVSVPEGRSGAWEVERFTVDPHGTEALRCALAGRSVRPGTYTRLVHHGGMFPDVVMSDTPAELRDHSEPIYRARGRVLIHGLGLGAYLQAVLRKPEVTHVDVVELSEDVIRLVWPTYAGDPRVHLHQGDALELASRWPAGSRWDCVWHDIWPAISRANLPDMKRLHRSFARRAGWQGSWCRWQCER